MDSFWTSLLTKMSTPVLQPLLSPPSITPSTIMTPVTPFHMSFPNLFSPFSSSNNESLRNASYQYSSSTATSTLHKKNSFSTTIKKNSSFIENNSTTMNLTRQGSALNKLRKNQKIINSQKERIEEMEQELDKYSEKCECLKNMVNDLEVANKQYVFFFFKSSFDIF